MRYYLILTLSAVIAGFGQLFLKLSQADIKNAYLYLGFSFYAISAVMWVYALKFLPLSRAYPFTFVTFALVVFLSYFILGERVSPAQWIGGALIVLGVMLIARG